MPENRDLKVKDIKLDLKNYRTIPQKTETDAINAMIAIKPDRFYAVVESIINNGYLPTENLIILEDKGFTVKEGNRRTAALKLIHGFHSADNFNIPNNLKEQINSLNDSWRKENEEVPCIVYSTTEEDKVNKIINLTHAKGEKASRDPWTSVAKARQNRDEKSASEPALDLLEKYIDQGKNLTDHQKEKWSGDYNLTVLGEALRKIISRLGYKYLPELVQAYPKIEHRTGLENILRDIGLESFGFKEVRSKSSDFAAIYNIPIPPPPSTSTPDEHTKGSSNSSPARTDDNTAKDQQENTGSGNSSKENSDKEKAHSIYDQRTVNKTLREFNPRGNDKQKLVTLRDELKKLKVKDNPLAFCFILRSMFEISANIYSSENEIPKKKNLKQQLDAVTHSLTANNTNREMIKALHGASSELSKSTGLLSVTSMNQLVHHPTFSIAPHDIFILFNSVYPLLGAMN